MRHWRRLVSLQIDGRRRSASRNGSRSLRPLDHWADAREAARQGQSQPEGGQRGRDGYHPLESTFLRIGLSDELTVAFGSNEGRDVLTVSGLPWS